MLWRLQLASFALVAARALELADGVAQGFGQVQRVELGVAQGEQILAQRLQFMRLLLEASLARRRVG